MLSHVRAEFLGTHGFLCKLYDPHPEADAFISADEAAREQIRVRYEQLRLERIARAREEARIALVAIPAPRTSRYSKRRDLDCPIDVELIRSLLQRFSVRTVEKMTGIGRGRINRLRAKDYRASQPFRRAWDEKTTHRDEHGRFAKNAP